MKITTMKQVIIVPLEGMTIKVSEDRNAVTIDGTDKVKGYALSGEWTVESEYALWSCNEWDWYGVVHAAQDTVSVATETIYALFFLLRRSDMKYAVLTRREDGRYYFLDGHDAAVNHWEESNQHEIVFDGFLPYPTTVYGGEVEVVGDAVPDLLNHLYETRDWCHRATPSTNAWRKRQLINKAITNMEQSPIFIPLDGIEAFPEQLRKGRERCPFYYIDLTGKGGTLSGYCCKDITTSQAVCYGNGLGKGVTQVLPCRFTGDADDYTLMTNVMPDRETRYIIIVPCKDAPPIVIGNRWSEIEVDVMSSDSPFGHQQGLRFACPYSEVSTPRFGGPVDVTYCTALELMGYLYGVETIKL